MLLAAQTLSKSVADAIEFVPRKALRGLRVKVRTHGQCLQCEKTGGGDFPG